MLRLLEFNNKTSKAEPFLMMSTEPAKTISKVLCDASESTKNVVIGVADVEVGTFLPLYTV